jgi:cytochrome c oxidase assembly protein Cox11
VNNITLSYTFFPVRVSDRPVVESANPDRSGRI